MYLEVRGVMARGGFKQLGFDERVRLGLLLGAGLGVRAMARELGRAPSTILRELRRNFPPGRAGDHLARNADAKAIERRHMPRVPSKLSDPLIAHYVREKLHQNCSPEIIAGRIKIDLPGHSVSYESIYYHVYHKERDLIACLPQARKQRRPRKNLRKHRGAPIPNRISISERPDVANLRIKPGHWEIDTMCSSHKGKAALLVLIDRQSRFTRIQKLPSKTSIEVERSLASILAPLPKALRQTLTFDNGAENSRHEYVNQTLKTTSYFCEPFHSWEKGSVENDIGLIRRFVPSGQNLDSISAECFQDIEHWLNARPRKCLNFATPNEIFQSSLGVAIGI